MVESMMLSRVSARVPRCLIAHSRRLYSMTPQFDESEMFGEKLEGKPYKAKRLNKFDYDWTKDVKHQASQEEIESRYVKMMKLNAIFKGLGLFVLIGGGATLYLSWPNIKSKYIILGKSNQLPSDGSEAIFAKKEPVMVGNVSKEGIHVLMFGQMNKSTIPKAIKEAFNKELKDLIILDDKKKCLGVDQAGNLVDILSDDVILRGQKLEQLKLSGKTIYALNKDGKILIIPVGHIDNLSKYLDYHRSWLFPWRKYPVYNNQIDINHVFNTRKGEKKISQFDVGKDHLVLVSNHGKAYTCSTDGSDGNKESFGQFGIPYFSKFDTFPVAHELHEIEMLNNSFDQSGKVISKSIEQVACGDYHTLARDSLGNLYSFGWNRFGQLAMPISYKSESIPYPKIINGAFNAHFPGANALDIKCIDLNCSAETSYVTMKASPKSGHIVGESKKAIDMNKEHYFAFGNGLEGELGNGIYKNSQQEPTRIKFENAKPVGDIKVKQWYTGPHHVICKLDDGRLVAWGRNDSGQLGIGKKIKQSKPTNVPAVLLQGQSKKLSDLSETIITLNPNERVFTSSSTSCIYNY